MVWPLDTETTSNEGDRVEIHRILSKNKDTKFKATAISCLQYMLKKK
jgi:hypothetical protein